MKQPVELSIRTSNGDLIYNQTIKSSKKGIIIKSELTKDSEWEKYLTEKWPSLVRSKLQKHYYNISKDINDLVNNRYGYSNVRRRTKIYKGKGEKYSYDSHMLAYRKAQRAYENLIIDRDESISLLKMAIEIWEREMEESDTSNKKARINNKISQTLLLNLIEAKIIIGDYDGAKYFRDKFDILPKPSRKYIKELESLMMFAKDEKQRNQ